jgi:DNA (cytosine-5)-methyltransferase 1
MMADMGSPDSLRKLTVRLPEELIWELKHAALDEGRTTQDVLQDAARKYLEDSTGARRAPMAVHHLPTPYSSVEVCAGAGGQAIGLEQAGFAHAACVEIDAQACATLRLNRPGWEVIESDLSQWRPPAHLREVDLLAGGVPCPPFSIAGQQLGSEDERDLFPAMIRLAEEIEPRAIMIENVRGLLASKFEPYRNDILGQFGDLGYTNCGWHLLNSADFGVPQARLRAVLVLLKGPAAQYYTWPTPSRRRVGVGSALKPFLRHWDGYQVWAEGAKGLAPAIVGGSKKHGGADLGPTRAKATWRAMGVDGLGIADHPPANDHQGPIRLTVQMAAAIQGFPRDWQFAGRKTSAYRQVGNAFPPPVARAVGAQIRAALLAADAAAGTISLRDRDKAAAEAVGAGGPQRASAGS